MEESKKLFSQKAIVIATYFGGSQIINMQSNGKHLQIPKNSIIDKKTYLSRFK